VRDLNGGTVRLDRLLIGGFRGRCFYGRDAHDKIPSGFLEIL